MAGLLQHLPWSRQCTQALVTPRIQVPVLGQTAAAHLPGHALRTPLAIFGAVLGGHAQTGSDQQQHLPRPHKSCNKGDDHTMQARCCRGGGGLVGLVYRPTAASTAPLLWPTPVLSDDTGLLLWVAAAPGRRQRCKSDADQDTGSKRGLHTVSVQTYVQLINVEMGCASGLALATQLWRRGVSCSEAASQRPRAWWRPVRTARCVRFSGHRAKAAGACVA